eukprot:5489233-Prymnesium_polylepis.1
MDARTHNASHHTQNMVPEDMLVCDIDRESRRKHERWPSSLKQLWRASSSRRPHRAHTHPDVGAATAGSAPLRIGSTVWPLNECTSPSTP